MKGKLLISAGVIGWESIEFKELLKSAREYLGNEDGVIQHKVSEKGKYVSELKEFLSKGEITHIFYDPRTGQQGLFSGFWEAVCVAFILRKYDVTPIVFLTDISFRKFRIKGALVSAVSGIAICYVSPKLAKPIFPHGRLFGPCLMPFSESTLESINTLQDSSFLEDTRTTAYFIGSLYEPRTTKLNYIKTRLNEYGFNLDIRGRVAGAPRRPDEEYWKTLIHAPIIITSSDQIISPEVDWPWIPNLVYRYLEALACGALLIAPEVPLVDRFFRPNIDFVPFDSLEDAIEKIKYYLNNPEAREKISQAGKLRASQLITSKIFWLQIDSLLSTNPLL